MYVVLVDDQIDSSYSSPVVADLRVKELLRRGVDASVHFDEGLR